MANDIPERASQLYLKRYSSLFEEAAELVRTMARTPNGRTRKALMARLKRLDATRSKLLAHLDKLAGQKD